MQEKNYLTNGDFEAEGEGWKIEGSGYKINGEDVRNGSFGLHFYAESDFSFTAEKTVKLPAGTYNIGGYLQGGSAGAGDIYQFYVVAGKTTKTVDTSLDGYLNWNQPEIKNLVLTEATDVTVGVKVKATAGAWGTWDDLYINGEEAAPVAAKNACTKLKAAKKSYTIKKKGKTVKAVFKITAADKTKKTTDKVTVKIKNKKIAKVTKKKLAKGKVTITVKGKKKGKTRLTVKVGSKSAKTTIKVKK